VQQGFEVHLSFGLSSLIFFVTIPGKILNGYMMQWIGRRMTIFLAMFLSVFGLGAMVLAHGVTGRVLGYDARNFVFVLGVVITGLTVLSSFPAVRIYMTEQFPTSIRGRGYFLAEMIGRAVAGIPVPFLLSQHLGSPTIFFGSVLLFSVLGAFVPLLFGRETVGQLELVTETPSAPGAPRHLRARQS
jgi:putative MFS transporter